MRCRRDPISSTDACFSQFLVSRSRHPPNASTLPTPGLAGSPRRPRRIACRTDRLRSGSVGRRSEEHTSELQSLMRISYAVFSLKKKQDHLKHINQIYALTYIQRTTPTKQTLTRPD